MQPIAKGKLGNQRPVRDNLPGELGIAPDSGRVGAGDVQLEGELDHLARGYAAAPAREIGRIPYLWTIRAS